MKHKIGIIGGSGALATSFLLYKINEYSTHIHHSKTDSDFLHTVTISTPFTHVDFQGNSQPDTLLHLVENLHDLEDISCNVIVMACNTIHEYWTTINDHKKNDNTLLLNLPQVVTSFIDKNHKKIGILCSEKSKELNLYESFLDPDNHQTLVYPDHHIQHTINECINAVIRYDTHPQYKELLHMAIDSLLAQNVDCVILGCTELSLLKPTNFNPQKIYDSVELLAIFLNQNFKDLL